VIALILVFGASCEERSFKAVSLKLYSIACLRNAFMADHLQFSNGSLHWNANFVRAADDWELKFKFFFLFFDELCSIKLEHDDADRLCLNPS
jgi:hypothetical protein